MQYHSANAFIAQLMGISWGALAGAFLAPFLYGLYMKRVTKAAVWVCFITGVGLTVSNMFLGFIDSPINAGAIAMTLGLIIVPIVSYLTPKPKTTSTRYSPATSKRCSSAPRPRSTTTNNNIYRERKLSLLLFLR